MTKTMVKWADEHRVGISSFDKQHRKLNEQLINLYEDVKNEAGYSKILKELGEIKESTIYHFEQEEEVMRQHSFHGYDLHKMQHDAFLDEINEFEELFRNGQLLLTVEIVHYIKVWFEIHIDKTDSFYADFLLSKGVR